MTIAIGKKISNYSLLGTELDGKLHDFLGKNIVLYFYPKDDTSGCTLEAQHFKAHYGQFKKFNTIIFGVSKDSMTSHEKFKCKYELPFSLIEDKDGKLCEAFDVIKEKSMYGRKYMGIERSTFLIDASGILRQEWRKVKVPGHVEAVLEAVKGL